MSALHILLLIIIIIIINYVITVTSRHNITAILYAFPEYTEFNNYLTQTKLNEEINNRETITVLVLSNSSVSALASKHPLSVLKDVLSLHILLDYYDNKKLHNISNNGTTLSVITLYNTTENSPGIAGFVNITTDSKSGKVSFGSAVSGSKLDSSYTKSVKQIPYNISVLEIDMPILAPGVLTAHAHRSTDVITITEELGVTFYRCKTNIILFEIKLPMQVILAICETTLAICEKLLAIREVL
ncbi:fasciclin-like arabinogalactan protein 8 [Rutidosis leptorrhynchoides]|uniref:fasciclin-like arabinogalactan protein 8 n=1 Tax=Rutidosis leptorrhynchoides TaxID=125765 RepID=UPI003A9A0BDD